MTLNKELLIELKNKYKIAKDTGLQEFTFQGHTLVTNYAKYLIEYAEVKGV